jgi:hypothetical protein
MQRLKIREFTEVGIGISKNEPLPEGKWPMTLLTATVTGLNIKQGRNQTINYQNYTEFVDYLNIDIKLKEYDTKGNLLLRGDHGSRMALKVGDILFLAVSPVFRSAR